jgi:hypothetical protein
MRSRFKEGRRVWQEVSTPPNIAVGPRVIPDPVWEVVVMTDLLSLSPRLLLLFLVVLFKVLFWWSPVSRGALFASSSWKWLVIARRWSHMRLKLATAVWCSFLRRVFSRGWVTPILSFKASMVELQIAPDTPSVKVTWSTVACGAYFWIVSLSTWCCCDALSCCWAGSVSLQYLTSTRM